MKTSLDEMLSTVRCLSIRQPFAELIARGEKTIELRTKAFKYRGPLVIVSCARRSPKYPEVDGPRSRAVALVEMMDARPAMPADSARACCEVSPGEFAWVLRLVRRLDIDVHVKGQLSIYPPPPELRAALEEALAWDGREKSVGLSVNRFTPTLVGPAVDRFKQIVGVCSKRPGCVREAGHDDECADSDRSESCDECGDAFTDSGPGAESLACPGTCVDCYLNDADEDEREPTAEDRLEQKEAEHVDRAYAAQKDDEP